MHCWKCGIESEAPSGGKLSFRAICEKCFVWLHCCKNCKNYKVGLPNNCAIPGTDYIADREACNFCEEFVLLEVGPKKPPNLEDVSNKLFGEKTEHKPKSFDDLFGG